MILISLIVLLTGTGCGSSGANSSSNVIKIAAAENFWGSIATQIAGDKAQTVSIVTNPDTDPHDYDPTAADGRTMAESQLAIINGLGYDTWAEKLLKANPDSDRRVINVGSTVGLHDGDNPHRWYSPTDVTTIVDAITAQLKVIDPKNADYFQERRNAFINTSLADYNATRASIKALYAGTAVGATESIFTPLAQDLGLSLVTPTSFLTSIAEGTDPTANDKKTVDSQIENHEIKMLVFNSQNATPDVQSLIGKAQAANIPIVAVTETLSPANITFQQWQTNQLQAMQRALESK